MALLRNPDFEAGSSCLATGEHSRMESLYNICWRLQALTSWHANERLRPSHFVRTLSPLRPVFLLDG